MKDEIIKLIKDANISQDDWEYQILKTCKDLYARGYLRALLSNLDKHFSCHDEEYRESFLEYCDYDIWNITI